MADTLEGTILFTAFEPSGDAHAEGLIRELKRRHTGVEIAALGGPRMQAAGAEILSQTATDGAMGLGGLKRIRMLLSERKRLATWMKGRKVLMHVGVDSPSANIRLMPMTRAAGVQTVQFVAPQFWAWAPWRLRHFRKVVDHVLCILPFEEQWFAERGAVAEFIGHPVVNRPIDVDAIAQARAVADLPEGTPQLLLLPGSRRSEIHANVPLLFEAFTALRSRHPEAVGVVVVANQGLVPLILAAAGGTLPQGLTLREVTDLEGVIDWADLALNTSGTVSLDLARQTCPMVAVYKMGLVSCIGSKFLLSMRDRLLPNIVAGRRIVPEFVPHLGGAQPIVEAVDALLSDPARLEQTRSDLAEVVAQFGQHQPDQEAADAIDRLLMGAT